jgi:hypothetical protein
MAGTFPPDYFSPDYFAPEYFGGEVDANAISTTINGVATVTANLTSGQGNIQAAITGTGELLATISVTEAVVEDDDSGYWARVVEKRRKKKAKARPAVPGVLAAKIVGRSATVALGEAPRVCWPCNVDAMIVGKSALRASIDGPDRIEEQDLKDLEDLVDLYMLLAA